MAKRYIEILKKSNGEPTNIHPLNVALVLDVVGKTTLNEDFGTLENKGSKLATLLVQFFAAWAFFIITPPFIWKYFTPLETKRHSKAVEELNKVELDLIRARKQQIADEGIKLEGATDFLTFLILSESPEAKLRVEDDLQVQEIINEILLGGTETTGNLLSFCIYYLARYPEYQGKLLDEIEGSIGKSDVTYADLPRLKLMNAFINEVNRLSMIVSILFRISDQQIIVGKYTIPKGTHLIIDSWVNAQNPSYFDHPKEFRPERWIREVTTLTSSPYFPFGGGMRFCPGQYYAVSELKTILATLIGGLVFELPDERPLKTSWNINTGVDNSLVLIGRPRK